MTKPTSTIDEIQAIKARLRELQNQQIGELKVRRQQIVAELGSIERQIAEITGTPVPSGATAVGEEAVKRKRASKLSKLVVDSEEYKELGRKIQTILAKDPSGLNGKQIAEALGYIQLNERNRIKDLLNDNRFFKKTGQGVSTRFFLR